MLTELWRTFPRLLERNINDLLDGAIPNPMKAFRLYKACQNEDLWRDSFSSFSRCLEEFFSIPKAQRRKSHFDRFLDRPMDQNVFAAFHLDFRTAAVHHESILNLASWAHNFMRVSLKTSSAVISLDTLTKTLVHITNPAPFEKAENIEFSDFCAAWKRTVFRYFGRRHDSEFEVILNELDRLSTQLKLAESEPRQILPSPTIHLTQTEIDWTIAVRKAATEKTTIPKFPLSRGPQKTPLLELERIIALYEAARTRNHPKLLEQRDNIRATLLDRCEGLLRNQQAS